MLINYQKYLVNGRSKSHGLSHQWWRSASKFDLYSPHITGPSSGLFFCFCPNKYWIDQFLFDRYWKYISLCKGKRTNIIG